MSTSTTPTTTSYAEPGTRRVKLTAGLTLAAGALFVTVPLLVELVTGDAFVLMGLAALLLLLALPGLRRLQAGADGRAGLWGLRLLGIGLAALVVLVLSGDLLDAALSGSAQTVAEGVFVVVGGLSAVAMVVGVVSFCVGMTRARVFPAAAVWSFLGGIVVALLAESFEQSLSGSVPVLADVLPPAGFICAGVGLLMLGRTALKLARVAPAEQG